MLKFFSGQMNIRQKRDGAAIIFLFFYYKYKNKRNEKLSKIEDIMTIAHLSRVCVRSIKMAGPMN